MTTNSETPLNAPALLLDNLVENVWGGDWIARMKGLSGPAKKIGESWEFSAHPEHPGALRLSDGRRVELSALFAERSAALLLKFIDARDNLSVQVHPPDDYARAHEKSSGKSESWLVLETGKGAGQGFIYLGFSAEKRRGFKTKDEFAAAFAETCRAGKENEVLSFLNKISVQPGDAFHVPPGTVHAIGRGVKLFEIQQSSGLTYRVWDWNRRARELHLEKAMQVLDFAADAMRVSDGRRLTDPLGHYDAEVLTVEKTDMKLAATSGFYVLTVLAGEMNVEPGPKAVTAGHSVFVPAGVEVGVVSAGKEALRAVKSWPREPRPSSE